MTDPKLNADQIVEAVEILSRRIYERFPQSGLYQVSRQLIAVSQEAKERASWIARPILILRLGTGLLIFVLIIGTLLPIVAFGLPNEMPAFMEFITVLEAGINDVIFIAAGIFFLVTLEARIKRGRAMDALHGLRVMAHIIDTHQLNKDPERVLHRGELTPSTPIINMTAFELSRYLDYCSEMLSFTGKIAAIYAQELSDSVVTSSVTEIEMLTSGISRKIWQKLMILHTLDSQLKLNQDTPLKVKPG